MQKNRSYRHGKFLRDVLSSMRIRVSATIFLPLACVIGVALGLGVWGGSPLLYHPDQISGRGGYALTHLGNPKHFHYPGGWLIYLHGAIYGAIYLPLSVLGAVELPDRGRDLYPLPGHLITLTFSLVGILCVYGIGRRIAKSRAVGLAAALLLGTSLLWVQESHFATVDVSFAAVSMVTILLALMWADDTGLKHTHHWLFLGATTGLASSVRYNGVLLFIPLLILALAHRRSWLVLMKQLALSAAIAGAVFIITNPYIALDFKTFWADFTSELHHVASGHFGYQTDNGFLFHLTRSLLFGYGIWPLLLAGIGIAWLLHSQRIPRWHSIALIGFPLIHFAMVGSSVLAFERYMLPVIPFLALFSAVGVYAIYVVLRGWSAGAAARWHLPAIIAAAVLATAVGPNFVNSLASDRVLSKRDTRADFEAIMGNVLRPDAKIHGELYGVPSFTNAQIVGSPEEADVVIMDSFTLDRYLYDLLEPEGSRRFADFARGIYGYGVIQISPFDVPKTMVPYSPKSVYSPSLPDLPHRKRPGPFIEIYLRDPALAEEIRDYCQRRPGVVCELVNGGYYAGGQQSPKLGWNRVLYSLGLRP